MLHARAEGRARGRSMPIPTSWSARATRSSARRAASPAPSSCRSRVSLSRWRICSAHPSCAERHRNGHYVTLRLTASMYHRFHAPHDCRVERVTYISGDTWNVNPIALARIERLFCRNERAVIETRLPTGDRAHAGAGRRDPGGLHPPALPAGAAEPFVSRRQCPPLRRRLPQGRRDGMVRARIDHRDAGARRVVVRRQCSTWEDHPPGAAADASRTRQRQR